MDGLNTYLICRAVHEAGFKMALSSLGGDEAVGGYSHFRMLKYLPMLRAMDAVPLPVGLVAAKLAGALGWRGSRKPGGDWADMAPATARTSLSFSGSYSQRRW